MEMKKRIKPTNQPALHLKAANYMEETRRGRCKMALLFVTHTLPLLPFFSSL